jgi:hypothetical protein
MCDGEIELDSGCAARRSNDGRLLLADNMQQDANNREETADFLAVTSKLLRRTARLERL